MYRVRFAILTTCLLGLLCLKSAWASYDSGPGWESYPPAPSTHHHQGWPSSPSSGHHGSHSAGGSYYHYHVPLVNQQQNYPQQHQDNHHLLFLLPLLLLAGLPLLLVPLLPLILLPLGLSLLALLLPLLMMGGMMMMMMMPGGMMMMMMRNSDHYTRHQYHSSIIRKLGGYLYEDLSLLFGRYARSLDLDHCPERLVCEAGSYMYPLRSEEPSTAKYLINYVIDKTYPKGTKARRFIRSYEKAFWAGTSTGQCQQHRCQPSFHPERVVPNTTNSAGPTSKTPADSSTAKKQQAQSEKVPLKTSSDVSKNSVFKRRTLATSAATSNQYHHEQGSASNLYYQYPSAYGYQQDQQQRYFGDSKSSGIDTTLYFVRHNSTHA